MPRKYGQIRKTARRNPKGGGPTPGGQARGEYILNHSQEYKSPPRKYNLWGFVENKPDFPILSDDDLNALSEALYKVGRYYDLGWKSLASSYLGDVAKILDTRGIIIEGYKPNGDNLTAYGNAVKIYNELLKIAEA
jgi:hypothetical protein